MRRAAEKEEEQQRQKNKKSQTKEQFENMTRSRGRYPSHLISPLYHQVTKKKMKKRKKCRKWRQNGPHTHTYTVREGAWEREKV